MLHVINFFLFISFSISLVGIFISETFRKNTKLKIFIPIRNHYISLALLILVNFFYGYQKAAVLNQPSAHLSSILLRSLLLLIFLCIPAYTWFLSNFQFSLIQRKPAKIFRFSFVLLGLVFFGIYLPFFFSNLSRPFIFFDLLAEIVVNTMSLAVLIPVSILVWREARKNPAKFYNRSIIIMNRIFIAMFSVIAVILYLFYFRSIAQLFSLIGLALAWSVINLTPMIHFKSISEFLKRFDSEKDPETVFALLVREYEITRREFEIISLISSGKTNQEISDALFIGLQTVKDHNSRIFKKLRVNNRVQMLKKIHDLKI